METLWFCLVALMLAAYVVFDGFDIGAGIIHLGIAKTANERHQVLRSIGPVWDGNEVWLVAAGGTLYFAFPSLYASAFSGFYLPLMIVLWLLILRGISIEFRNHIENRVWGPFWDVAFAGASALLAVFFGAALGNVVRGVPLGMDGFFFLPLWTNFRAGSEIGILDWYTILVGVAAFATLTQHGALWVALKTESDLQERAKKIARTMWWVVAALTVAITAASFSIQPHFYDRFSSFPLGLIFPMIALAGLLGMRFYTSKQAELLAFLSSATYICGMLTSAAYGMFPYVLPARGTASDGLTVYNAAAGQYGLQIGLIWWIPGMLLVIGYFIFTYRQLAGKVRVD
jgi:cytochrome d ubiquinol oxidase subunit II